MASQQELSPARKVDPLEMQPGETGKDYLFRLTEDQDGRFRIINDGENMVVIWHPSVTFNTLIISRGKISGTSSQEKFARQEEFTYIDPSTAFVRYYHSPHEFDSSFGFSYDALVRPSNSTVTYDIDGEDLVNTAMNKYAAEISKLIKKSHKETEVLELQDDGLSDF